MKCKKNITRFRYANPELYKILFSSIPSAIYKFEDVTRQLEHHNDIVAAACGL